MNNKLIISIINSQTFRINIKSVFNSFFNKITIKLIVSHNMHDTINKKFRLIIQKINKVKYTGYKLQMTNYEMNVLSVCEN